jgi:voltage-gated sodium channel
MKSKDYVQAYGELKKIEQFRIKSLARLVYSNGFELAIAAVITINAIALAMLTFPDIDAQTKAVVIAIDAACLFVYTSELLLRIISYGTKPWEFFKQGWNVFDFLVIASTPFFAGQTVVLRLLRLFRLVRIFRFLPEVRILSSSITKSLPPLLSMSALIALLLFLYGMVGHYLFGNDLEQAWGTIGASMMTLIILLTLENFPVYLEEALIVTPVAVPYLLSYVFIIVFTVLNLLIGIVLNAMDEARAESKARPEKTSALEILADDVEEVAADGVITTEEVRLLRAEVSRLRQLVKQEKK